MKKKTNEEFRKFVSNRISKLKNAKNLSARELSLAIDQSSEYINQIESGRSMPSIERLKDICDYLKISLSEFFDERQEYPLQYAGLIKELNKLDEQELAQVISLIKLITRYKKWLVIDCIYKFYHIR